MRHSPFQRMFDLLVALPLAVAALPICVILLIVVRIDSPGPPLFVQERVGRWRRPFRMLKIRTMQVGTDNAASHEVPIVSITRVGGLMRALKLDELPQVWNVIVGDMSLVGPRPCLPSQLELISLREEAGLYEIRPGITGPAQIEGIDMSEPKLLSTCEAAYFSGTRAFGDWPILLGTFAGRGRGDAAVHAQSRQETGEK